jgi:hypothetical protein
MENKQKKDLIIAVLATVFIMLIIVFVVQSIGKQSNKRTVQENINVESYYSLESTKPSNESGEYPITDNGYLVLKDSGDELVVKEIKTGKEITYIDGVDENKNVLEWRLVDVLPNYYPYKSISPGAVEKSSIEVPDSDGVEKDAYGNYIFKEEDCRDGADLTKFKTVNGRIPYILYYNKNGVVINSLPGYVIKSLVKGLMVNEAQ